MSNATPRAAQVRNHAEIIVCWLRNLTMLSRVVLFFSFFCALIFSEVIVFVDQGGSLNRSRCPLDRDVRERVYWFEGTP